MQPCLETFHKSKTYTIQMAKRHHTTIHFVGQMKCPMLHPRHNLNLPNHIYDWHQRPRKRLILRGLWLVKDDIVCYVDGHQVLDILMGYIHLKFVNKSSIRGIQKLREHGMGRGVQQKLILLHSPKFSGSQSISVIWVLKPKLHK